MNVHYRGSPRADEGDKMPKGRPRREPRQIDKDWFRQQWKAVGLKSQAQLARIIGRDPSLFTRSIQGERSFNIDDLAGLANALGARSDEVMRRLGYDIDPQKIPYVGKIIAEGKVSTVSAQKGLSAALPNFPAGTVAYTVDVASGPLAAYNGAAFLCVPCPAGPVSADLVGRLCVVEADNQLTPVLGVLGKGPSRGSVTLEVFGTSEVLTLQRVHRCGEIRAIIFA